MTFSYLVVVVMWGCWLERVTPIGRGPMVVAPVWLCYRSSLLCPDSYEPSETAEHIVAGTTYPDLGKQLGITLTCSNPYYHQSVS